MPARRPRPSGCCTTPVGPTALGRCDDGTTVTDWMEQERERGITIVSAAVTAELARSHHQHHRHPRPHRLHGRSAAQPARARRRRGGLRCGAGVEPQSETVWRQADRYSVPRICFVNKMDRPGADPSSARSTSIRERLGANPVAIQVPIGSEAGFPGVVDLLARARSIVWKDDPGVTRGPGEIPSRPERRKRPRAARAAWSSRSPRPTSELTGKVPRRRGDPTDELRAALRRATIAGQGHAGAVRLGAAQQGRAAGAGRRHRLSALAAGCAAGAGHQPGTTRRQTAAGR